MANSRPVNKKNNSKYAFRRFCAFVVILVFVWWFNNYTLKITETSIASVKIAEPVKLAVISDLHAHTGSISNKKILGKINKISPDIVVIMGDMYSRGSSEHEKNIAIELMTDISAEYITYFVPGDHDTSMAYMESLSDVGIHVMNYKSEIIEIKNNSFKIMGIDNVHYTSTFDLTNAFAIDENCYNILLAHIPNFSKFANFGADLTICADTHGGMIQLPFGLGAGYDSLTDRWFPELRGDENVYDKGWFDYENGSMFITSGIGDSPYPVRFCNRPEVVSLEIIPGQR